MASFDWTRPGFETLEAWLGLDKEGTCDTETKQGRGRYHGPSAEPIRRSNGDGF
jgi:hypothetical protein